MSFPNPEPSDGSAYQRIRKQAILARHDGLPRQLGMREMFVILAVASLAMQASRWLGLDKTWALHALVLLACVTIGQTLLFTGHRYASGAFFGGGVYGLMWVAYFAEPEWKSITTIMLWPFAFGFGGALGLLVSLSIVAGLRKLIPLAARNQNNAEATASTRRTTATESADVSSIHADAVRFSDPTQVRARRAFWLCALCVAGLLAAGYIIALRPLFDWHRRSNPPDWIPFVLLVVGWVLFGLLVLIAPRFLHAPRDPRSRALSCGAKIGALAVVLPLVAAFLFFGIARIELPESFAIGAILESLFSLLLILGMAAFSIGFNGAIAYGVGYGAAFFFVEFIPATRLHQYVDRVFPPRSTK